MIHLFTGLPGSSKTLNVLKLISEDDIYKDRDIYYYGIEGLTLPWTELSLDEVKEWYNLPPGAVVVIDEAQKLMPQRDYKKDMPAWVAKMDTHRHQGHDVVLMTQHPMLIDASARRFIGRHTHIERHFGMESAKWLQWEKCINDPEDFHKRKEAVVKRVKFDKAYYGKYKSAEVHTVKKKIPLKIFIPIVFFLLSMGAFGYVFTSYMGRGDDTPGSETVPVGPVYSDSGEPLAVLSPVAYMSQYQPRVPDVPWTAPIYDELTKPKTFPKPNCMVWISGENAGGCTCYSQQATVMQISHAACMNYVEYGYFDHTREPADKDAGASREREGRQAPRARPRSGEAYYLEYDTDRMQPSRSRTKSVRS